MPMSVGDRVSVRKGRDAPAAITGKTVEIVKIDELSIWVEKNGQTYVLDRSQVSRP